MENFIEVHAELSGTTYKVGSLKTMFRNNKTSAVFSYDEKWRDVQDSFSLEPSLSIGPGDFFTDDKKTIFSSIGDSSPDTWGRRIMQRNERSLAKQEERQVKTLTEIDYLLGVSDFARLGSLRFRRQNETEFQSKKNDIPVFLRLPELLNITDRFLKNEETDEDIAVLFAPASSMGGARPKASILDKDGHLAIAKFPKESDPYSIETFEFMVTQMAKLVGIKTSENRIERVNNQNILISRRFDRKENGQRIPYLSAMSMLNLKDGERSSYPEIVESLKIYGKAPEADIEEIFKRMVFNVLISNVDDHLRNHGFLWNGNQGWTLSPAFDLNPIPMHLKSRILSTRISPDEATCSIELVLENIDYFDIDLPKAKEIIKNITDITIQWKNFCKKLNISSKEMEMVQSAFEHSELSLAQKITSSNFKI